MAGYYPGLLASGVNLEGRFDQFDLYVGESDIVTDRAQAADGQAIAQFQVLTYDVDGRLIPWAAPGEFASGTATFSSQPTAADTITINGVVITFETLGAVGPQVNIGLTTAATAAAFAALINGVPDSYDENGRIVYGTPPLAGTGVNAYIDTVNAPTVVVLTANEEGTAPDAITLAISGTYPTLSGTTLSGAQGDQASGLLGFTAVATATQTVTINGHVVTFETGGASGNAQSNIGATATDSAQNLKALINANPAIFGCVAQGDGAELALTAIVEGAPGNLIGLAHSNTNPTISAATLTGGGTDEEEGISSSPVAIAAQAVAATTPGTFLPIFTGGVFNHQVLGWPPGVLSLAQRRAAFARTNIGVAQLL